MQFRGLFFTLMVTFDSFFKKFLRLNLVIISPVLLICSIWVNDVDGIIIAILSFVCSLQSLYILQENE